MLVPDLKNNRSRDIFSRPRCIIEAEKSSKPRNALLEILIFVLVIYVGSFITTAILIAPMMINSFDAIKTYVLEPNDTTMKAIENMLLVTMRTPWFQILSLFSTAVTTVSAIFYCTKIEKRRLFTMGFLRQGAVFDSLVGILAGAVTFAAAVAICLLSGSVRITWSPAAVSPLLIVLYFIGYLIQGMSEEVLCRGYFMVSLSKKYSLSAAIFLSSVLFGLLHLSNTGINAVALLNLILYGIFSAVYFIKRGSIWGVAAFHGIWNFVQGVVFGIQVSGTEKNASLLTTELTEAGKALNGGAFGLEGGYAVTVVLLVAIIIIGFMNPAKREREAPSEDSVSQQ